MISTHTSIAFEADEGLNEWQEDIYENQIRAPFSSWTNDPTKSYWSDVRGDKLIAQENEKETKELTRDDIQPPEGWRWAGDWKVDKNRACDEEGDYRVSSSPSPQSNSTSSSHTSVFQKAFVHLFITTPLFFTTSIDHIRLGV